MGGQFFLGTQGFTPWDLQHIVVLLISALVAFLLIWIGKNKLNAKQQHQLGIAFSFVIAGSVVLWTIIRLALGEFDIKEDLPFYLCDFLAITLPYFMIKRNPKVFEVLYFWILAGTLQALISPHLPTGFPHYNFFKFWIVHCGLVIAILYVTIVFKMRPRLKGIGKAYLYLQPYFLFSIALNFLLNANYNYLNAKPSSATLLDYMGPWPWYIIVGQLIMFPLFLMVFSPFFFLKKQEETAT